MTMSEYREKYIEYDVTKHGDIYEPIQDFGLVCPECCSTNIEAHNDSVQISENMSYNDYSCKDCGCEFRAHEQSKLTEKGYKICNIRNVLVAISAFSSIGFCSASMILGFLKHKTLAFIFLGVAVILFIVSCIVKDEIDKLLEDRE